MAARAAAAAEEAPVRVLVSIDPDIDPAATADALRRIGELKATSPRRVLVEVAPSRLQELASVPGVVTAEPEPKNRIQNNVARGLLRVAPTAADMSLDGSGEILGVADSGLDKGGRRRLDAGRSSGPRREHPGHGRQVRVRRRRRRRSQQPRHPRDGQHSRRRVRSGKTREPRTQIYRADYTYGAYGRSPLRLRYELPKKLIGVRKLKIVTQLLGRKEHARNLRYKAYLKTPYEPVTKLLKRYRRQLGGLVPDLRPDSPKLSKDLLGLVALDRKLRAEGKKGLFRNRTRRIRLTRNNRYTDTLKINVTGLQQARLTVLGSTKGGYAYQRLRVFDART